MILVLIKGVWLSYYLHMCIFDFSIFCLESDFPICSERSRVSAFWTEAFISSADRIGISRFTAEYIWDGFQPKGITFSKSQSLRTNCIKLLFCVNQLQPRPLDLYQEKLKGPLISRALCGVKLKLLLGLNHSSKFSFSQT